MADFELDIDSNAATSFNAMRSAPGVPNSALALYIAWEGARRLVNVSSSSHGPRRQVASRCLALTNAEYHHAVRAPFLLSALSAARLAEVSAMVRAISRELVVSISYTYWLPYQVRTSFEEKVRRMRWILGVVPSLQNWSDVDRFYRHYPSATGIFGRDYLSARKERMSRYLESLKSKDVDSRFAFTEFNSRPAYVAPNTAVLPAASLLPPLLSLRDAPEVNYGLLGSVMLQTMLHAFDEVNGLENATWEASRVKDFIQRIRIEEEGTKENSSSKSGHAKIINP
ncbi:endothelin-converting enzyme homolog isoform X2 [Haemaphysalis longicornis]